MSAKPELAGQSVVVIGGSSGIGLETARRARAANWVITDVRAKQYSIISFSFFRRVNWQGEASHV
jgi:NAD(P)-dependent dehydrogenase (short-subunit alcohol dehydrogenase family)